MKKIVFIICEVILAPLCLYGTLFMIFPYSLKVYDNFFNGIPNFFIMIALEVSIVFTGISYFLYYFLGKPFNPKSSV